jgi:hypothetical protein
MHFQQEIVMETEEILLPWAFWKIWLLCFILTLVLTGLIGKKLTGHARGFLLDDRNKYSLSQLQIVAWTMVIIPGLAAIVLAHGTLKIGISSEVLALMGISLASLGGSLVIKGQQASSDTTSQGASGQTVPPAAAAAGIERQGRLAKNHVDTQARWSDIFKAEIFEEAVTNKLDFGKFQLFLVTLVVIVGYVLVLFNSGIAKVQEVYMLPDLSKEVVTLIAISHAGYLGIKVSK